MFGGICCLNHQIGDDDMSPAFADRFGPPTTKFSAGSKHPDLKEALKE